MSNFTGLCTYHLKTRDDSYVYDVTVGRAGIEREFAQMWLWSPEELEVRVAAIQPRSTMVHLGALRAERARP